MRRPSRIPLLPLLALLALLAVASVSSREHSACGPGQSCSAGRDHRDIVFPGEEEDDLDPITKYLTPEQIEHLNNLDLDHVVGPTSAYHQDDVELPVVAARILPQLSSRIGGGSIPVARSEYSTQNRHLNRLTTSKSQRLSSHSPTVATPVPAKCQPTLQPVSLKKPDDLSIMYWPYCMQLERCSGCCINDRQQSCQPTQTEMVPFKVSRYLINGVNGMVKNGTEILHLERHLACSCSCITKARDCNALQEYSPRECRCNCGNTDEKRKCLSQSNKLWDHKECRCLCRQFPTEVCTTGLEFDLNSCMCKAVTAGRRRPDNTYKLGDDKRKRRWHNRTSTLSSTLAPLS